MQRRIRYPIALLVAIGLWTSAISCWAGFDEGLQAYLRGDYATALREWGPLAEQRDKRAQVGLGHMYEQGYGVPQDYTGAAQWYRKAAERGNELAQALLGYMYAKGQGVPQDYPQALSWWRKAAEQGIATAQFNLGQMYSKGQGVPQDYTEALSWYRKAAEQGDASAQYSLGLMYAKRQGVPRDYPQALSWWHKAAEQDNTYAQFGLGVMYENGHGVPQNYLQAHLWYNLASAHSAPGPNHDQSLRSRDIIAARLTPTQLAKAQRLASAWRPRLKTSSTTLPAPVSLLPVATPAPAAPIVLRRTLIRQVQARLQTASFDLGPLDGTLGPKTRDALRGFQQSKGLSATGEADTETLNAIGVR